MFRLFLISAFSNNDSDVEKRKYQTTIPKLPKK
jgi:hypothetical protein